MEHTDGYRPVPIYQTFYLESLMQAKTIQAFYENWQLSMYAACETLLYLGEIHHFQRQMFGINAVNFICDL